VTDRAAHLLRKLGTLADVAVAVLLAVALALVFLR